MGVTIVWDDPQAKNALRYDIEGDWDWDDVREAVDIIFDIMDKASAPRICAIVHFKDGIKIPRGGMKHFNILTERSHPKAGLTVIVGAGRFVKSAIATASNLFRMTGRPLDFSYANTLEDAQRLVAEDLRINGK